MNPATPLLVALSLVVLSACGGGATGSTPSTQASTATSLAYLDPATTTGFSLIRNAASTPTHLVLDLVGTSGTQTMGVAFFLAVDPSKAAWSPFASAGGAYVSLGNVIPLANPQAATAPAMVASKVTSGAFQAGLFQYPGTPTTLGTAPILSVALDLGTSVPTGAVTFVPMAGMTAVTLQANGTLAPITVNVGTLTAH